MRYWIYVVLLILLVVVIETNPVPQRQEIYFPEDGFYINFKEIDRCANGSTYCENFKSYPVDYLRHIIHNSQFNVPGIFKNIKLDLSRRVFNNEENICSSRKRMLFPKIAQNDRQHWKIIVNFEKYTQGVVVQLCMKETSCNLFPDGVPLGFVTRCKQDYSLVQLLSEEDGELVFDYFKFPTACSCILKRNYNYMFKRSTS